MNRNEIVKRLMNEGLSVQTLVKLNDKQLIDLSKRMLSEQPAEEDKLTKTKVINTKVPGGTKLAQDYLNKEKPLPAGTKVQVKETEKGKGKKETKEELKGGQKNLDKNKNGKLDKEDFKLLRSKKSEVKEVKSKPFAKEVKEGKSSPFAKEVKEGGKKSIQKVIHPSKKGTLKKSLGVKKDETIPTGKLKSVAKKGGKLGQRARLAMTLKKLKESVETEEWVDSLVENKYHSIALKKEIMELIQNKIDETEVLSEIPDFMSYDSITDTSSETETKPITKPVTKPVTKPKTPIWNPGPKENPGPSARSSNKILDRDKNGQLDR